MQLRSRIALACGCVSLVALPPVTDAATKKKTQCTKVGGDTIFRDKKLRLIRYVKTSKSDPDAQTVTLKFCKPGSTATPKTLETFKNTADGSLTVDAVVRGGTNHLGLELAEATGTSDGTDLFVYDLVTRKRTFAYGSDAEYTYALTTDGGVAILEGGKLTGYDGSGEHALAAGAAGLAAAGNAVYWTVGPSAFTSTLTGEATRTL